MKNRFGVARCCCVNFCEDCCNGNAPTEWDVEVALSDGGCTTCDELIAGTYTLARLSNQICRWRFSQQSPAWYEECSTGYAAYGDYITFRSLSVDIRCVTETQYYIVAYLYLGRTYTTGTEKLRNANTNEDVVVESRNGSYLDVFQYEAAVDFTEFNCSEQVDFELDYVYASIIRNFQFDMQPGLNFAGRTLGGHAGALPIGEQYDAPSRTYWKPICEPPVALKLTSVP